MPPRNHKSWLSQPKVESISSTAYNCPEIFAQEQELIFKKVFLINDQHTWPSSIKKLFLDQKTILDQKNFFQSAG